MAKPNNLIQVEGLIVAHGLQTEVVNDQEVGRREAKKSTFVGSVASRGAELFHHVARNDVEDLMSGEASSVTQGLCNVTFPDASRTEE